MKNNIFIDYILRARNTASAAFNTAGDDARGYAADLDKVSHSGFKFGRNQDSVVQPALAMSTSRSESFVGSILKWGATIFGLKAAFNWLTGQLYNTTNSIGNMTHSFANVPGSIGATVQLSGRSMREVFKYRDVMRQVARDIRNSDVGASVTDWKNALFGLLQAGIRDIRVMKDLAKEAIILGHALHIDPEVISTSFGRLTLEMGFTKEQIHNLSGALSLLRTNGFEVTQQSLSKIDNKMKAFAGAFGPDKIKDIYASSAALAKYGDAQYILTNIMDASTGDQDAWVKINKQVTASLGESAGQAMNAAMRQGDLTKAVGIYIKAIPGLASMLKTAGIGAQELAESLGLDREKTLALEKGAPRMGAAYSKVMAIMSDQAKIATAAQDLAKEATDNFGSRLVALAADITDRYGHIKDNISTRLGGILPTNFGKRIEDFFDSIEAGINGFLDKNAPELRAWWTDVTSGWGKFDSTNLTLSLDKFWKEHKFDKEDIMTFLTTLKTLAIAIKDIIVGTMSLMTDLVLLFADDDVTKGITDKTTAMEKAAIAMTVVANGASSTGSAITRTGELVDTISDTKSFSGRKDELSYIEKIPDSDITPRQAIAKSDLAVEKESRFQIFKQYNSDLQDWLISPITAIIKNLPFTKQLQLANEVYNVTESATKYKDSMVQSMSSLAKNISNTSLSVKRNVDGVSDVMGEIYASKYINVANPLSNIVIENEVSKDVSKDIVNAISKGNLDSNKEVPPTNMSKDIVNAIGKGNVNKSVDEASPLSNIVKEGAITSVPLVDHNEDPVPIIIPEDARSTKLERGLAGLDAIISKNKQKEVERASEPQPVTIINRNNNEEMLKATREQTGVLIDIRDAQPTNNGNAGKEEILRYAN